MLYVGCMQGNFYTCLLRIKEGSTAVVNDTSNTMMQRFWDSTMALTPNDDEETPSEGSLKLASEGQETGISLPFLSSTLPNAFAFKIHDGKGRMHRFTSGLSE
ncbi:unnamed protein product [Cuscuta epithymum]|uniref:Uncharacterized protein n=1 Tax=Cuscuta epithymum TaxID=186058 RepID=A0AAV0BYW6_9ASTE|nr:unnamed protein product [Cuscuta epithymum]